MGEERRVTRGDARRAILEATLDVVAADGIDAVTHRRVAARAGVSLGSTTHHFASRDDLLRAAFRYYLQEADAFLYELQGQAPTDPVDQVEQVIYEMVEQEFAHARLVRAEYELLLYASGDPELAADVRVWESRMVARLAGALEAAGAARPIESARVVLNLVRGYELERLLDPRLGGEDLRQRLAPVLAALTAADTRGGSTTP